MLFMGIGKKVDVSVSEGNVKEKEQSIILG